MIKGEKGFVVREECDWVDRKCSHDPYRCSLAPKNCPFWQKQIKPEGCLLEMPSGDYVEDDVPSGLLHDVGINYYLGRGYLEYKNSWVLPFELPWYTRWLLGLIKRLGVSGFWRKL